MKRIAIIGPPGAGKTTLAKELERIHEIKIYHLDRIFWQQGWKGKPRDTRIDILQRLVGEKQWIIEGFYLRSSNLRLEAADTIIFLDMPPLLCLQRIIKRHHEYSGRSRRDIPEGSTDKLTLLRMLKVLAFPLREGRKLEENLHRFPPEKVIRLHSTKEIESFLAQLELHIDEKRQSSKTPLVAEERHKKQPTVAPINLQKYLTWRFSL
jgi:adenylate kinase family enzyme